MKTVFLLIFTLLSHFNLFADQSGCEDKKELPKGIQMLKEIESKMKILELEALAKDIGDKVIEYKLDPVKKTCSTLSYKFPEVKMKPNDSIYFYIPQEYRDRGVRFIAMGHRQQQNAENIPGKMDDKPGLSSVQLHSKDGWSFWQGQASG